MCLDDYLTQVWREYPPAKSDKYEHICQQFMTLHTMGFSDFQINHSVLKIADFSIDKATEILTDSHRMNQLFGRDTA
jgi:hypothetical protein